MLLLFIAFHLLLIELLDQLACGRGIVAGGSLTEDLVDITDVLRSLITQGPGAFGCWYPREYLWHFDEHRLVRFFVWRVLLRITVVRLIVQMQSFVRSIVIRMITVATIELARLDMAIVITGSITDEHPGTIGGTVRYDPGREHLHALRQRLQIVRVERRTEKDVIVQVQKLARQARDAVDERFNGGTRERGQCRVVVRDLRVRYEAQSGMFEI
uniref:Putative secreted protein n=1 Tax=Anopheles marajoara TaxID=58244 RepID=A0A2M4C5R0_9DIPT